jgi:hypothetical protein
VGETSGSIIRGTVAAHLIRIGVLQTDLEGQRVVIHSPIGGGPPVINSPGRTAISAVLIEEQRRIVAELAVAMVIVAMQGTEVVPPIGAEAQLESGHQVETDLVRAIDLATREIAVVEIELAVATWEVVLGIGAPSEMVADLAAAVRVQAAVEELPVWVVRVGGALAELAAEEAVVVAVVGGSESHQQLDV